MEVRDVRRVDGADLRARTFATLLDRRALDRAYRYATLVLGGPADAEDAVHDAALTAWRQFGELREPARFEAWFGRIVVNTCRDRMRRRWRIVPIEAAPEPSVDPIDGIAGRVALAAAIRGLDPDHREVVVLRYLEDLTIDQIAERTGARPGTVKSRLHHALRRLRDAYTDEMTGTSGQGLDGWNGRSER